MVTLGQACCMALDMEITPENRETAKRIVEESLFGVTYLIHPTEPITMAKSLIAKNPFRYKSYLDTPPGSSKIKAIGMVESEVHQEELPKKSPGAKDTNLLLNKPDENLYSQRDIIDITKIAFLLGSDKNIKFYNHTFITLKNMYEVMKKIMPKLEESITARNFSFLLNKYSHYFGYTVIHKGRRGRYIYVLKDKHINYFASKANQWQKQ